MRLSKLQILFLAIAHTTTLSLPVFSQVINRDPILNPFTDHKRQYNKRRIIIQSLTVLNDTTDVSFCKERYGDEYILSPVPNEIRNKFVSNKGHTFSYLTRNEIQYVGIYAEHSLQIITFPKTPDVEVEFTQFITGFTDSKFFDGVFSDGICSGKFSVVEIY